MRAKQWPEAALPVQTIHEWQAEPQGHAVLSSVSEGRSNEDVSIISSRLSGTSRKMQNVKKGFAFLQCLHLFVPQNPCVYTK